LSRGRRRQVRYADRVIGIEFGQELPSMKASQQLPGTVPVGVPVSTAEPCRSVSVLGGAWCAIGRTPEENRETSNDLDLGLAPVTPEAAGSSPVDPANYTVLPYPSWPPSLGIARSQSQERIQAQHKKGDVVITIAD
jgi:hypothetical protein